MIVLQDGNKAQNINPLCEELLVGRVGETQLNTQIRFIAESFRVLESPAPIDDFVDVEVAVLSTNVTGNGRQYILEDLQKNTTQLNSDGGLIFSMGRHPNQNEEPDATDNVGVGQTYMENDLLKSKARIYNTSTFPDMVKRIKLGLVRDVSIEGMVNNFKKVCTGDGCWQRAFGLIIQRAVFVHAGADPLAKIERIFESLERDMKNMTNTKKQDDAPDATATTESTPVAEVTQAAPEKVKDETKIQIAEAAPKIPPPAAPVVEAAPAKPEPVAVTAPPAPETAPKTDVLEKVLGECADMKKMMSDMMGMFGEMKNMMGERQVQSSPAQEAAPAAIAESQGSQIERPPRVKESQATPNAVQSSFFNEVKKLVR
jgi:Sec-independent protein translocase protein TatA